MKLINLNITRIIIKHQCTNTSLYVISGHAADFYLQKKKNHFRLSDAQTAVCCDFPTALQGTWYRGFGAASGGIVPYYTDSVQSCSYDAHTIPDSPNNNATTSGTKL